MAAMLAAVGSGSHAWAEPPAGHGSSAELPVDFSRDIRSVLSDKCFVCHGPDEKGRAAGLRLDLRDEAIDAYAITPGAADESEIIARITSTDPDTVMPPPETGKAVSSAEVDLFRRWIDQGAAYDRHWAFDPPRRPELPRVANEGWCRSPIDYFVLDRMTRRGFEPAPPAQPHARVRRMFLDLVGLPPGIGDLKRYAGEDGLSSTESLAEHLLASEHFGERWARWWLDAARYADSDGYEKDKPRTVWFYRDYVIDSLNADKPYDKFVIEQIAGDLLPDADQESLVATGFLRNSMTNEEGGADPEQFRVEGMFDRVDAIGKAILGVTTQCAQCHTHKYDPLTHEEYYSMFAALNDFHEATVSAYTESERDLRGAILHEIDGLRERCRERIPDWRTQLDRWRLETSSMLPRWTTLPVDEAPYAGQKFRLLEDGSILSESYAPTKDSSDFVCQAEPGRITAVRIDLLNHPQLPLGGPGRSIHGTGALTEFEVRYQPPGDNAEPSMLEFSTAFADVNPDPIRLPRAFRNEDPESDDRITGPVEFAIDGNNKTAWTTDTGPGRRNVPRHAVFVLDRPLDIEAGGKLIVRLVQKHGGWNSNDNQNYLMGRYRFSTTADDDPSAAASLDSRAETLVRGPVRQWTDRETSLVFDAWRIERDDLAAINQQIGALWRLYPAGSTQLTVAAMDRTRETFVMARGDFLSPADRVTPRAPAFLGEDDLTDDNCPPRLSFARWLVRRDAPTTARVIVNRIWQAYFGRGLVETPEDFGFQSSPPSHPELLDFLAVELIENDWSLKHIHRLIVNSATYAQDSRVSAAAIDADPANRWLARGPRFRVDAELVRDIVLTASGLIEHRIGGPSVYPPAPRFLFLPPASYGTKRWDVAEDGDQYRRSLYIHQYRSVPFPPMQVFDAPKGDAACVRRSTSNTPLQALVMLNEPQFVEAARAMAARVLREIDDGSTLAGDGQSFDRERIVRAFRLATARVPDDDEIDVLMQTLSNQRVRIAAGEIEIAQLVGADAATCRQLIGQSPEDIAAWMAVCRVVLNLDETISKN